MGYKVLIDCEREEGLNVSKDALAEAIVGEADGLEFTTGDGQPITVTSFTYVGSKKGKPMEFLMECESESEERIDSVELDDALALEMEGIGLDVEAPNDGESMYSITTVEVQGI